VRSPAEIYPVRKAFTLIELLVVIAIIAILAAILFPVFAQAKLAAKKTQDLSNTKQIATAIYMYCGDYDDTTPTINSRRGGNPAPVDIDYYVALYPYVKNMNVFLSPGRRSEYSSIGGSGDDCVDGFNTTNQCIGYGWNWGITSGAGSGLTYARSANGEPGYDPLWRTNVGKNFSQIEQTASMFAAGNTGDSPRFTICVNYLMQYYSNTKSSLFFNGKHNMAFLDGHAKSVAWTIGTMSITGSDVIALPAAKSDAYKYCDQPDSVDTRVGMTCRAYADLLYSVYTQSPN
jgi:prepilin-type N-terminal cleavage/methylation domain-containing protein/prepilin-type processing-associated H-X9-DG protein